MSYSGGARSCRILYLIALLYVTSVTNACMNTPMFICHPNYFDVQEKESIESEIHRLEKTIAQEPNNSRKSGLYLHLAILYSHHKNPTRNYGRSLEMFEKFLVFDPDSLKNVEVLYMKNIVQEMVEVDKKRMDMANKAAKLQQNNKKAKAKNAKIGKENKSLKEKIERLKLLEIMLEKKRLNLK